MSIEKAIDRCFQITDIKKYPKVYIAVDLHDTIIASNFQNKVFGKFFEGALKTLSYLSKLDEVCLILYTSSYPENVILFNEYLKQFNIKFDYFNSNPECENTETGDFRVKFYYSLLLDDKAGFDPETDWEIVFLKFFERYK